MLKQIMTNPKEIIFEEVSIPTLQSDQVMIKIARIGVCGSDIHVYHGKHPFTSYPVTQGHEVSGQIVQVGASVKDLQVGQKATIEPQVVCGNCYPCRHGKYNLCEQLKVMGFQTTGTASEFVAVSAHRVTLLPETMSYNEGAMIEPVAVAVHAAARFNNLTGANVMVLGCGPIGILLAQACRALGAAKVLITDVSDTRLNIATQCGVDFAINTAKSDLAEALTLAFGTDKADVIYDCAGNDITMGQAITLARKGSTIVLVAVFAEIAKIDLAVLNDHELTLDSSMMYRHEDYLKAISLVGEGKIQLAPLISKHFAFADYLKAYQYIDDNRESTMKVLVDVTPEMD